MALEIPKPFGIPDAEGFYRVGSDHQWTSDLARKIVGVWPKKVLEYMALGGYIAEQGATDLQYNFIVGLNHDSDFEKERLPFMHLEDTIKQFEQAAKEEGGAMETPHLLFYDPGCMDDDFIAGHMLPGTRYHELALSSIPLWEKPGVTRDFFGVTLTPFELMQQLMFQFNDQRPMPEAYRVRAMPLEPHARRYRIGVQFPKKATAR